MKSHAGDTHAETDDRHYKLADNLVLIAESSSSVESRTSVAFMASKSLRESSNLGVRKTPKRLVDACVDPLKSCKEPAPQACGRLIADD